MKLSVASLNFSGINTSPFEYDDGSDFFAQVNHYIRELVKKEHPALKDWEVGKIDKEFVSDLRQSVCFNPKIQTVRQKFFQRLPSRQEFMKIWRERFSKWMIGNNISKRPTEEELNTCISMDYIFYRALLQVIYKVRTSEQLEERIKEYPPFELHQFLEKQFNKPSTKVNVKKQMAIEYLNRAQPDVFCLQEAGCVDWEKADLPGYSWHQNHDSVIIFNKEKLGEIDFKLTHQFQKHLDFNKDSSFVFTNKNYLLLSVHLKSKKQVNVQQAKEMFSFLKKMKSAEFKDLKIIIGMDANNFLAEENLFNQKQQKVFSMAPDRKTKPTTVKQRSFMQAQFKKAGQAVSEVKDHIASTLPLLDYRIERIDGKESSNQLLPNHNHPYDHYVVKSTLLIE